MIQSGQRRADAGSQPGESAGLRCPPVCEPAPDRRLPEVLAAEEESAAVRERMRLLLSTVETQIIPRLVIAHRSTCGCDGHRLEAEVAPPRRAEVDRLVGLLLDPGAGSFVSYADDLIARGNSLDVLYLEVLAPSARRLGEMWSADEVGFADVTIALGRMHQLLRHFSPLFRPEVLEGEPWRRALFASVPGEQHTLGLSMLVQYFLRAGWDASLVPASVDQELMRIVQHEHVALIGLSMSSERSAQTLRSLIGRLRSASCNGALRVIVGGVAFVVAPGLVAEVGADGTACDALVAVKLAQQLVL